MGSCCVRESAETQQNFRAHEERRNGKAENNKENKAKSSTQGLKRSKTHISTVQTPITPSSHARTFSRLSTAISKEATPEGFSEIPNFPIPTKRLTTSFEAKFPILSTLSHTPLGQFVLINHSQAKMQRIVRIIRRSHSERWREVQFRSELDQLRKLDHPHVLQYTEVLYDSKRIYAVSEPIAAVRNVTFEDVAAAAQSEAVIANLECQLLQTMCYCHANEVVHGDLNAMNVFIFDTGTEFFDVKITGFGGHHSIDFANEVKSPNLYTAPEAFRGAFGPKTDVWGCGVLLHVLACRELPYRASTKDEFLSLIGHYPPGFTQPQWGKHSSKLRPLVKGMLRFDVEWRLSVEQCLQDEWVVENAAALSTQTKATVDALANMKLFTGGSEQLTMSLMSFVAQHILTSDELRSLTAVFHCIDSDNDGTLNYSDLVHAYAGTMPRDVAELLARRVLECVDIDRNGSIDFSEFVLAATERKKLLSSKSLILVFNLFDEDGSGDISLSEFKSALKLDESEAAWDKLMKEIDENGDGVISFDEFAKLVKKTANNTKGKRKNK